MIPNKWEKGSPPLKLMCWIRVIHEGVEMDIKRGIDDKLVAGAGFEPTTFGL